jgi:phosphoglycolate phosphatase-like HAD superfamily hydrolase
MFGKAKVLKELLNKENLNKDDCIYIGDEVRDIEACKEIGLRLVSVTWGYNVDSVLKAYNPDFLANTPQALNKILSNL